MSKNELKPCPFCGQTPSAESAYIVAIYGRDEPRVYCPRHSVAMSPEVWNTRATTNADRVRELEAALRPFAEIAQGEAWERFITDAKMTLRINGGGSRHFCFINAECFEAARDTLNRSTTDGK